MRILYLSILFLLAACAREHNFTPSTLNLSELSSLPKTIQTPGGKITCTRGFEFLDKIRLVENDEKSKVLIPQQCIAIGDRVNDVVALTLTSPIADETTIWTISKNNQGLIPHYKVPGMACNVRNVANGIEFNTQNGDYGAKNSSARCYLFTTKDILLSVDCKERANSVCMV